MKGQTEMVVFSVLLLLALVNGVRAADESSVDKLLGSPLLILVALLLIVAIAFVYHKIRK